MVSQVLANAILNQKAPDILGSFREGQEFAKGQQVKQLAGEALQAGGGERLQELIGLDPEVGYALADAIGARNAKELNSFVRDARIVDSLFKSGSVGQAKQFIEQSLATAVNLGQKGDSQRNLLNILNNNGLNAAGNQVNAFLATFEKSKQETSSNQDRDRLLNDLNSDNPDVVRSAEIALKLKPGAGNDTAAIRAATDPVLGDQITRQQSNEASGIERARLTVQGQLAPGVAADTTTATRKAIDKTTSGALDISTNQLALDEAKRNREAEIIKSTSAKTAALAEADGAIDRIDGLLSKNRFTFGFGKSVILTPDLAKSQTSLDVIAELDQIRGLVSLESRQKLAGQGTISDSESQTLEKSATVLSNPLISNSLARSELIKIRGVFEGSKKREALNNTSPPDKFKGFTILSKP
jgi:hypothetical protein